jgi:hypothetical protein
VVMSIELYTAPLAMDSYNRGYGQGLDVVAAGASTNQIGNATFSTDSTLKIGLPQTSSTGF